MSEAIIPQEAPRGNSAEKALNNIIYTGGNALRRAEGLAILAVCGAMAER